MCPVFPCRFYPRFTVYGLGYASASVKKNSISSRKIWPAVSDGPPSHFSYSMSTLSRWGVRPPQFSFIFFIFSAVLGFRTIHFSSGCQKFFTLIQLIRTLLFQDTSVVFPALPLGLVIALALMIYKKSPSRLFQNHPVLYVISFGMVGAKVTNKLVVRVQRSNSRFLKWCIFLWNTKYYLMKIKPEMTVSLTHGYYHSMSSKIIRMWNSTWNDFSYGRWRTWQKVRWVS